MEMAKRGVPGVWTYGFYDGWVPNYLFWIALTHNSFGRFYEVQSYGPDINAEPHLPATATSREWYRPESAAAAHQVGTAQQHQHPGIRPAVRDEPGGQEPRAVPGELLPEEQARPSTRARTAPTYGWLIPAAQRRKADAADMVNELRTQGVEVHRADSAFKAGNVDVAAGDYIVRADQPYRTLANMYFSVQNYPAGNPGPYDDTGWTMQYMRDVKLVTLTDAVDAAISP